MGVSRHESEILKRLPGATPSGGAGWYRIECPICPEVLGKSGGDTMGVKGTGHYHCFRCGARGRVRGADAHLAGAEPLDPADFDRDDRPMQPPNGYLNLADADTRSAMITSRARAYLESRGLGPRHWKAFDVGCVLGGFWGGRIIVPLKDAKGRWLGFVARTYVGHEPKYLYPKGMPRALWNPDALHSTEYLVVVEGVFDALPHALRQDVVATLGAPTDEHIEQLGQVDVPIVLALDADAARKARAFQVRLKAVWERRVALLPLPPGTDPGDMGPRTFEEMCQDAANRC